MDSAGSPWKLEIPPREAGSPQCLDFVEGTTKQYWKNGGHACAISLNVSAENCPKVLSQERNWQQKKALSA